MISGRVRIRVLKSRGELQVRRNNKKVKTYPCITGASAGDKEREGDRRTPEGLFRVVWCNPHSKFHLSLGLNYPDLSDARRGLDAGLLTPREYEELAHQLQCGDMTDPAVQEHVWKTPLGGEIFIHGGAAGRAATAGCVALSDADMTELYALCPPGTPVEILP